MKIDRSINEYFHVSDKPVRVVEPGPTVFADSKWKLIDKKQLVKRYSFAEKGKRDQFVVRCLASQSQAGKQDVTWLVDDVSVTVSLQVHSIGITENIVEFAKNVDSQKRDIELAYDLEDEDDSDTPW